MGQYVKLYSHGGGMSYVGTIGTNGTLTWDTLLDNLKKGAETWELPEGIAKDAWYKVITEQAVTEKATGKLSRKCYINDYIIITGGNISEIPIQVIPAGDRAENIVTIASLE